jgi:hypothetical protein
LEENVKLSGAAQSELPGVISLLVGQTTEGSPLLRSVVIGELGTDGVVFLGEVEVVVEHVVGEGSVDKLGVPLDTPGQLGVVWLNSETDTEVGVGQWVLDGTVEVSTEEVWSTVVQSAEVQGWGVRWSQASDGMDVSALEIKSESSALEFSVGNRSVE